MWTVTAVTVVRVVSISRRSSFLVTLRVWMASEPVASTPVPGGVAVGGGLVAGPASGSPRVRGAISWSVCCASSSHGSPPRARGSRCESTRGAYLPGFTPARAGHSPIPACARCKTPVHPRARGAVQAGAGSARPTHGSPPRARGSRGSRSPVAAVTGFTPASAGQSLRLVRRYVRDDGSPPRPRGSRCTTRRARPRRRRVGSTFASPALNRPSGPRLSQAQACALARARASRAAARWSALRSIVLRSMHSLHRSSFGSMRPHVSVSGGHSGPGHGHHISSAGRALSIAVLVDGSLDAAGLAVALTCVLHAFPGARAVIARNRRILTEKDRRGCRLQSTGRCRTSRSRSAPSVDRDPLYLRS